MADLRIRIHFTGSIFYCCQIRIRIEAGVHRTFISIATHFSPLFIFLPDLRILIHFCRIHFLLVPNSDPHRVRGAPHIYLYCDIFQSPIYIFARPEVPDLFLPDPFYWCQIRIEAGVPPLLRLSQSPLKKCQGLLRI